MRFHRDEALQALFRLNVEHRFLGDTQGDKLRTNILNDRLQPAASQLRLQLTLGPHKGNLGTCEQKEQLTRYSKAVQ